MGKQSRCRTRFENLKTERGASTQAEQGLVLAEQHVGATAGGEFEEFLIAIIELEVSTATVALAHGVEAGRIAKTLVFRLGDGRIVLLVASSDRRIDNRKFKDTFGKGKMLPPEEVAELTGHPVGGMSFWSGSAAADLPRSVLAGF